MATGSSVSAATSEPPRPGRRDGAAMAVTLRRVGWRRGATARAGAVPGPGRGWAVGRGARRLRRPRCSWCRAPPLPRPVEGEFRDAPNRPRRSRLGPPGRVGRARARPARAVGGPSVRVDRAHLSFGSRRRALRRPADAGRAGTTGHPEPGVPACRLGHPGPAPVDGGVGAKGAARRCRHREGERPVPPEATPAPNRSAVVPRGAIGVAQPIGLRPRTACVGFLGAPARRGARRHAGFDPAVAARGSRAAAGTERAGLPDRRVRAAAGGRGPRLSCAWSAPAAARRAAGPGPAVPAPG